MTDQRTDIRSMTLQELAAYLQAAGEPAFRAKQVFAWLHAEQALSYDDMTNLPKALRETLAQEAPLTVLSVKQEQRASDGTGKYLLELPDGFNALDSSIFLFTVEREDGTSLYDVFTGRELLRTDDTSYHAFHAAGEYVYMLTGNTYEIYRVEVDA